MIVYRKPPFIVDDGAEPPSNGPRAPASPSVPPEVEDEGDIYARQRVKRRPRTIGSGPTKKAPVSRGLFALVSPACGSTGTASCTATTSTTTGSATFGRAVRPRRSGRCVRSAKGARIVASLRSCSVRRRVWSARCRAIDCHACARSARLCNAVACGIDLGRARICTALCERCRSNHQCRCRSCYQRLLHAFPRSFYAPS
jgi:hypothetical protein